MCLTETTWSKQRPGAAWGVWTRQEPLTRASPSLYTTLTHKVIFQRTLPMKIKRIMAGSNLSQASAPSNTARGECSKDSKIPYYCCTKRQGSSPFSLWTQLAQTRWHIYVMTRGTLTQPGMIVFLTSPGAVTVEGV